MMNKIWLVKATCRNYECCGHIVAVAINAERAAELKPIAEASIPPNDTRPWYSVAIHGPYDVDSLLPNTAV